MYRMGIPYKSIHFSPSVQVYEREGVLANIFYSGGGGGEKKKQNTF